MAFGFVQNTGQTTQGTTSSTIVIPVTHAPSAGNLLVAALSNATASATLNSVTDSKGNTWTIASNFLNAASPTLSCQVAYTLQDAGALTTSDTITATFAVTSVNIAGTVDEFTIPAGTISVDISPVNGSTGVTAANSGSTSVSVGASQAIANATELVLCMVATRGNASQTFTQGSGWTKTSSIVKSTGQFTSIATEYQVTSSTGAQTGTWTLGVSTGWAAVLVSFKASAPAVSNWIVAGLVFPS